MPSTPGRGSARHTALVPALLILGVLCGCRRDMQHQPKALPLEASRFFADGRTERPIPPHTIARSELDDDQSFYTGASNGQFLASIPAPITRQLLLRGQQRFDIYCTPCHGILGDGDGMVARRGFKWPANFHTDRLRQAPPGYIYQVISRGYGAMPDYAEQIAPPDRWAIVAYVRALQLSRHATVADVPAQDRAKLDAQP
jgi:mono/diheme cytochrome c family protein